MDSVEAVVEEMGLEKYGDFEGDIFIIELDSSDVFSSLLSEISSKFDIDNDLCSYDDSTSVNVYSNDFVEITATANYDQDLYSISIGRK